MTTMLVLNVVIAVLGIALVAGVMRLGYRIGGEASERRVVVLRTRSRDLEDKRAA